MRIRGGRSTVVYIAAACLALILAGIGWRIWHQQNDSETSVVAGLPHRQSSTIDVTHLEPGIVPPTNHWFSGLALTAEPHAVFPLPLSFKPANNGFTFGLPQVTTTVSTIFGSYRPDITIDLGATAYKVSRYDSLSVSLHYYDPAQHLLGTLTVAEGSPCVSYVAEMNHSVQMPGFAAINKTMATRTIDGQVYVMVIDSASSFQKDHTAQLVAQGSMVLYPVPTGASIAQLASDLSRPLDHVATSYAVQTTSVTTTLTYVSRGGGATIFAALPGQSIENARLVPGVYKTIYGSLKLYQGNSFRFTTPRLDAASSLPVEKLSKENQTELERAVLADAAVTDLIQTDSYFGGKELYRAANLYTLARQLHMTNTASVLKAKLENVLSQWLDGSNAKVRSSRYFYYDTAVHGLVGSTVSFGSQDFNDHHFHYGYFLYALGVVGRIDHDFAQRTAPMARLLADDIASPVQGSLFPQLRVFDPNVGHSWASGFGPFDDGNNQESSGEAINAWSGLGLWAQAVDDHTRLDEATWLLSREAASSQADWLSRPTDAGKYVHQTVGINWGGKRDFATFFSADSGAPLGIQLLPSNPAIRQLASLPNTHLAVQEASSNGNYARQFGDYLLMYRASIDQSGALAAARILADQYIDNANSRSYMLAWIMTHSNS